jgi:hypothetical protein
MTKTLQAHEIGKKNRPQKTLLWRVTQATDGFAMPASMISKL